MIVKIRILYMLPWFHAGTGQETTIENIVQFGQGRWDSGILSNHFLTFDGLFPTANCVKLINYKPYYRLLFPFRHVPPLVDNFDIIHIMSGAPYLKFFSNSKKPVIYNLHGPWATSGVGYKGKVQGILANNMERRLLSKADTLVAVSKWVQNYYVRRTGLDVIYIPDSFDFSRFKFKEKIPDKDHLKLLIVGDWDGFKGRKQQHELIRIMPMLTKEFPGINLRLVGINPTDAKLLMEYAEKIGSGRCVSIDGKLSPTDLLAAYYESDILVVTSTVEGFHRPTVEAMACGRPVLARDSRAMAGELNAGHFYHVRDSGGGETFDVSFQDITEKLWLIIENYSEMSVRARHYSLQFDNEKVGPLYEKLYAALIDRKCGVIHE